MRILKRLIGFVLCCFVAMCFCTGCIKADMIEQGYTPEPTPEPVVDVVVATPAPVVSSLGLEPELEMTIEFAADYYNLPADLVRAVIWIESRGVVDADNGLCVGLMQINRDYANAFMIGAGVDDIEPPVNNILCGCWWLSELMDWANGQEDLRLMAYNLGQSKARKYWNEGTVTKYALNVQEAREKFI